MDGHGHESLDLPEGSLASAWSTGACDLRISDPEPGAGKRGLFQGSPPPAPGGVPSGWAGPGLVAALHHRPGPGSRACWEAAWGPAPDELP